MKPFSRLATSTIRRLRGVAVSALVGRSGMGKSFRARLLAEKHGIDIIIDDGLLIRGDAILTGHWAKKEESVLAATRRALFGSPDQAREAREVLRATRFRKVLIVGTSRRMADRIACALDLPPPTKVFRVDELASDRDVRAAGRQRVRAGSHAVPLPLVTIRRGPFSALTGGIATLLGRTGRHRGGSQFSVRSVTPADTSTPGGVSISEPAVRQMVAHCVAEHDPRLAVEKIRIWQLGGMYSIEVGVRLPFKQATSGGLHQLREYILHSLERYAGVILREVRIVILAVDSPPPLHAP